MSNENEQIIEALVKGYTMELETAMNYLANSIALDGIRAEEIKKALAADIQTEMGHASMLANRIKTIGGSIPGSLSLNFSQEFLQPPQDTTDVVSVIKGVIQAEFNAMKHYNRLIRACEGVDYVTQDLVITILAEEEEHHRVFRGYLTEYEKS